MRTALSVALAGLGLLVISATVPVRAHHSFWVEFDVNNPVQLEGTVTRMEWINPHVWLHIDVTSPDGTVEPWMIEGGTPATLFTRGFAMTSLLPGMTVTVEGYRARSMLLRANGGDITFPDGRKLFFSFSLPTRPDQLERRRATDE
jgi:hypothetical protein